MLVIRNLVIGSTGVPVAAARRGHAAFTGRLRCWIQRGDVSLISCPECKKHVSDSAAQCPNCGLPLTRQVLDGARQHAKLEQRNLGIGCLVLVLIAVILALGPCRGSDDSGKRASTGPSKISAFVASQDFVEDQLKAPGTAKFPWYDESFVVDLGGGRFRIKAYVDAENSFGAKLRTRYSCILRSTGGDTWHLENIEVE